MKSWIANLKNKLGRRLIVPVLTIAMVGSFVTYDFVKAMPARAAMPWRPTTTPLDNNSVGALLSLDQAMETLAARVTPAIVNVTVTSRTKPNLAGWRRAGHAAILRPLRPVCSDNRCRSGSSRALSTGWAAA